MSKNTFKSIGAVLAGFFAVVVLSIATDILLEQTGIFPARSKSNPTLTTTWVLALALLYRTIYTILGGYITALLAPTNPGKHVHILGIIGTVAGILGVIAGWNLSAHWYPIALAVLAYPSVWIGGKLRLKK
ncbi:MAG TPA: hypothetical protein VEC16_01375 [Alphaproteobacteria bacterium]|nr:hypothetical protein [Alphaproteobacteria bacterium]